ncbi:hypothetical protein KCU67_g48, partial [Aureobasidium melanogenum]
MIIIHVSGPRIAVSSAIERELHGIDEWIQRSSKALHADSAYKQRKNKRAPDPLRGIGSLRLMTIRSLEPAAEIAAHIIYRDAYILALVVGRDLISVVVLASRAEDVLAHRCSWMDMDWIRLSIQSITGLGNSRGRFKSWFLGELVEPLGCTITSGNSATSSSSSSPCIVSVILSSLSSPRCGRTMRPAELKVLSGSSDIAGIVKMSTARRERRGH